MQTNDYDNFVIPSNWQRPIKEGHIQALVDSMTKAGNQMKSYPIKVKELVDGRMLVLDGQHRLKAAERLGEEVHYTVVPQGSLGAQDVLHVSRATRSWTQDDVLNSYASRNRSAYKFIKDAMDKYGMSTGSLPIFIGHKKSEKEDFLDGRTTIDQKKRDEITTFLEYVSTLPIDSKNRTILRSLWEMYQMDGFDADRLKRRLQTYTGMFQPMPKWQDTLENLISVYNYRTAMSNRL